MLRAALVRTMTLQKAKSIARHLGLTLRELRSGNFRVNFRDGDETTAYYTDNLEEAVNAAVEMARKRPSAREIETRASEGFAPRRQPRTAHQDYFES